LEKKKSISADLLYNNFKVKMALEKRFLGQRVYKSSFLILRTDLIYLKKIYLYACTTQLHLEKQKMIQNYQKEIHTHLARGLLDMIVLQYLNQKPTHGYRIITKIRKDFGICLGPSTVYPLLGTLEKKGYVKSTWQTDAERPIKVYQLTNDGKTVLNFTEKSLTMMCNIAIKEKIVLEQTEFDIGTRTQESITPIELFAK
jgi:PadR family transcriptional regulator PadR